MKTLRGRRQGSGAWRGKGSHWGEQEQQLRETWEEVQGLGAPWNSVDQQWKQKNLTSVPHIWAMCVHMSPYICAFV